MLTVSVYAVLPVLSFKANVLGITVSDARHTCIYTYTPVPPGISTVHVTELPDCVAKDLIYAEKVRSDSQ